MQMWTKIGSHHLNNLLRNRRYPKRPDMTINVPGLKSPVNMDNNYGLRLTAYYRVGNDCLLLPYVWLTLLVRYEIVFLSSFRLPEQVSIHSMLLVMMNAE